MISSPIVVASAPSVRTFALAACTLAVVGCGTPTTFAPPPPPKVTVAQPVQREVVQELEFTGTTRSPQAVDVRARINGYLERIAFEDGADVKAGDLLFVIEAEPFEAALDSANASLQKAEAELALAEADLKRTEPLVTRGALTPQELDVKKANVATSQAEVASARAVIRQAEWNLGNTQIKAPISGRVSRHLVDVGNLVQSELTILTRIESFDPIHAYFAVSESDVLEFIRLSGKDVASIRENPPALFLGLASEEGFPHEGRLDFAEVGVDPETGTQLRRGAFPNPDGTLVPGLFARLRLPIGDPEPGLMVPDRAIATDQRGEYVLVVNDKKTIEYRPVELGARISGMRVIREGVAAEDWVVVNGIQRARPGSPVDPEQEVPPSGDKLDNAGDTAVASRPADPELTRTAAQSPAEK